MPARDPESIEGLRLARSLRAASLDTLDAADAAIAAAREVRSALEEGMIALGQRMVQLDAAIDAAMARRSEC